MVNPHVLLGIGHFGPRRAHLKGLRRMIPFLLIGPVRHYLGESGTIITHEPLQGSSAIIPMAGQRSRELATTEERSESWSKTEA